MKATPSGPADGGGRSGPPPPPSSPARAPLASRDAPPDPAAAPSATALIFNSEVAARATRSSTSRLSIRFESQRLAQRHAIVRVQRAAASGVSAGRRYSGEADWPRRYSREFFASATP